MEVETEQEVPVDVVGRRVSCGGERATVRYAGPVPPTSGLWLGVEWDNPERGKHDGSHEGVQYFTCRHPKGGSFVRPAKVSFGVDYLTAVQQQYQTNMEEVLNDNICISNNVEWLEGNYEIFERRGHRSGVICMIGLALEFYARCLLVFLHGSRKDYQLERVTLNMYEVNGPGLIEEIRKTTPHVNFLDLSNSLLCRWEDVAAITEQMDKLETLEVSNTRLSLPSDPSRLSQAFQNLHTLVLRRCNLTWEQILVCAPMWPQLEMLYANENNITELQRPEGVLQSLKYLSLSCNPLVQDSVLSLSALPRLNSLNLSNTGLSDIRFDDAAPGCQTAMFPVLETLTLDGNNITEWSVINELAKLPSLVSLSCSDNRLVSSDGKPETANQMIIAKLEHLVYRNNSAIMPEDRRGAEIDYIKMFGEEWLKSGGPGQPNAEFIRQHPRYQKLISKYGAPDESEIKKPEPYALKNHLLRITFVFPDDADRKPIEKKLPDTMLIQKVKVLLNRLLKVPYEDLRLTYTSPKMVGTEFELDRDLRTLHFYSVEDGDQVLVRWS